MKATPRKLAYADSDKEDPAGSLAKGFSDRFSLESSGTSDTRRQTRSTIKSQKTPSKNKEPTHLRRSRRLEDQSTTREKARRERSKSRRKRSGHQETSSDSEYEEGNKDPEDHLGIFSAAAEQEECVEELSQKFLEEFSQQKRYAKDPTEIHGIKRRQNEGLQAFMDRFKSESSHIKGVPPVLGRKLQEILLRKEASDVMDESPSKQSLLDRVGSLVDRSDIGKFHAKEKNHVVRHVALQIERLFSVQTAGLSRIRRCKISMIGFSKETYHPLGVIDLRVTLGKEGRSKTRMMEKVLADQRGWNVEIYLEEIVIESKSELGLVQDVKETLLKLKRVNFKIDPTMSYFGVKEGRFIGHMRMEKAKESGWTNEAKEALRMIKRKLSKLQTLAIPKEGEDLMICLWQRNETISSVLLVERERIQIHVSYVKVVTDGPMEETLKLARREGRLGKCATEIREQVEETPDVNKGGIFNLSKGFQANSTPTTRAWRLYLGRETIEEGSGVGIILISPKEKMYSYAIWLKFKASNHAMDCEALLAGLAASANQGMKDLHVFIDSLTLVTQVEGNHTPATEQERRYKEEIMDAMVPFHRFRITHLPKILNLKAEVLTGLATIKLEFLNQEVSVGIKTRPSVEETSNSKKGKATSKELGVKPNCNHEASGSN
ncbi:reverse transcriptase domain-containing protein [Tanacetum coccineum]